MNKHGKNLPCRHCWHRDGYRESIFGPIAFAYKCCHCNKNKVEVP